jgi:hypothetical protein
MDTLAALSNPSPLATPVMAMIVPFRGARRINLQQLRFGVSDQGGGYVRSVDDTRAIGRIESYSEHEEPQVVRAERVLKYIMWVASPLAWGLLDFG